MVETIIATTLTVYLISKDTPLDGDQRIVPTHSVVDPPTRKLSLKDNEEKDNLN